MDQENGKIPARLQEIIEDFQWCEGREKLELLLQFAESMPPMPERLADRTNNFEQVNECMTPVFVRAENKAGKLHFYFDVPEIFPYRARLCLRDDDRAERKHTGSCPSSAR